LTLVIFSLANLIAASKAGGSSTLVESLTSDLEVKGSNPGAAQRHGKYQARKLLNE
jgi:hypothetical protein